jgi:hypothetical protein
VSAIELSLKFLSNTMDAPKNQLLVTCLCLVSW